MAAKISVSKKIVEEILDKGLRNSKWAETFPDAYRSLVQFREDLEHNVRHVLIKNHKQLIKALEDI